MPPGSALSHNSKRLTSINSFKGRDGTRNSTKSKGAIAIPLGLCIKLRKDIGMLNNNSSLHLADAGHCSREGPLFSTQSDTGCRNSSVVSVRLFGLYSAVVQNSFSFRERYTLNCLLVHFRLSLVLEYKSG